MVQIRAPLLWFMTLLVQGCGSFILEGGYPVGYDATPSGSVVAQGQFFGANGKTVSGTAAIYSSGSGTYTLRLESLVVPSEPTLQVSVIAGSETLTTTSLVAYSGDKNYSFNLSGNKTFSSVKIFSSTVASPLNVYANALLTTR